MSKFERALWNGDRKDLDKAWSLQTRYSTPDHSQPHMMGSIIHGIVDSESLVAVEVLTAM